MTVALPVSVVIITIEHSGREDRLREVVSELLLQSGVDLELILVYQGDQGADPRYLALPESVQVLVTDFCGSAESRNRGARMATKPLLCFFDDDTFPIGRDFIVRAAAILSERELHFLTCNIDSSGDIQSGEAISRDFRLNWKTVIPHMWEPGLTIPTSIFQKIEYDPTLGIACIHGSSEGFDLGVRLLRAGFKGERVASLKVSHPPLPAADSIRLERAFFYALGNGATLIQHGYYIHFLWILIKTAGRGGLSLLRGDMLRAQSSFVRLLSLLIGPVIPRQPARLFPPKRR